MRSRATFSGRAPATLARRPVGRAARSRQMLRDRPEALGRAGVRRVEDRPQHLGQQVGAAGVHVHAHRRDDHQVGAVGQAVHDPADGRVDRGVDVVEGPAEHLRRRVVELAGVELREVPELVAGDVGGTEGQPHEVEPGLGDQHVEGVGHPTRGAEQPAPEAEHLVDGVAAEDLVDGLGGSEEALQATVGAAGLVPLLQHDAVVELPAADQRPGWGVLRRPALVGVDGERAGAGAAQRLPHRRRGVEVGHVVDPLLLGVPLERVEEPVVLDRDPAVERVLGAGGELGGRGVEVVPDALAAQVVEHRQPALVQEAVEGGGAGRVELEDGEHGISSWPGPGRLGRHRWRS